MGDTMARIALISVLIFWAATHQGRGNEITGEWCKPGQKTTTVMQDSLAWERDIFFVWNKLAKVAKLKNW